MILCPKCKNLAQLNPYFGVYECSECNWEGKDSSNSVQHLLSILSTLSDDELKMLKLEAEKLKSAV